MAIVDSKNYLSIIKVALDEDLRIIISYKSEKDDITALYEFIFVADIKKVKCVSYTSTREDPLKIFNSTFDLYNFLNFIETEQMGFDKTIIKLYPKDWYACFETDENRIKDIEKMMPDIIKNSKNVNIDFTRKEIRSKPNLSLCESIRKADAEMMKTLLDVTKKD